MSPEIPHVHVPAFCIAYTLKLQLHKALTLHSTQLNWCSLVSFVRLFCSPLYGCLGNAALTFSACFPPQHCPFYFPFSRSDHGRMLLLLLLLVLLLPFVVATSWLMLLNSS